MNTTSHPIHLSPSILLGIYAIIPFAFLLILADLVFWSGALRQTMPRTPDTLAWFTLLFNLPHIIASFFPFLSTEALSTYRGRLFRASTIILAVTIPLLAFAQPLAYLGLAIYTVIHVISQQSGLSRMFMQYGDSTYSLWKWSIVVLGCLLYLSIYGAFVHSPFAAITTPLLFLLCITTTVATGLVVHRSRTRVGAWYAGATGVLVLSTVGAYTLGYFALAIIMPRVVHDITAFAFYLTHSINSARVDSQTKGGLFRSLHVPPMVAPLVVIGVSIFLAYLLTHEALGKLTIPAIFFISLLHYHSEGFAWKGGSVLRKEVVVAN